MKKELRMQDILTEQIDEISGIKAPYVAPNVRHVFHQYTVRVEKSNRDELMQFLNR
jgi:perosamine synthetase